MNIGKVYIVGAGPGAPDLISVRGFRALLAADAVLIDRLLPQYFLEDLDLAGSQRIVRWLGEDEPRLGQEEINQWLIGQSRAGQIVVRLKGGDPFVFGRGEEEIAALSAAGVPWEVIPGPSTSTAVPTASGFPLTRRAEGRSFAVATARVVGGAIAQRFPRADSLVILMGLASWEQVVARLLSDGWPSETPAAAIESGTMLWERRVQGKLSDMGMVARQAGLASPATFIVGEAAASRTALCQRPVVLFTGLDPSGFRWLGNLLHWPALQRIDNDPGFRTLSEVFPRLRQGEFDWLLLTDKSAVSSFLAALRARGCDARALSDAHVAAIGAAALRLDEHGLLPDARGEPYSVVDAMRLLPGQSVLVVYGTHVVRKLEAKLAACGTAVTALQLHRLAPHAELGRPLPEHDAIYFAGPTAVRAYWHVYGPSAFRRSVWCLGEQTRQVLKELAVDSHVVARPEDIAGIQLPRASGHRIT
jgi:uroporphyrin-III C-methyltransferase